MSSDTRFRKGQSGNPKGRPKKQRPHISAFDIVFDKTLAVTQGGKEQELTIEEALQYQTYQAALKGGKPAIRKVLKMIEKREVALAKMLPSIMHKSTLEHHYDANNADEAMRILGIIERDPFWGEEHPRDRVATWATQAALSRPGRKKFDKKAIDNIRQFTMNSQELTWPRGRIE